MTDLDTIDQLCRDDDFVADIRELLICWWNDGDNFTMTDFLMENPSRREHDMREVHVLLRSMHREHLTELAMRHSLCPIHFIDWAICFDDEPEDCAQIRTAFPHGHDT